MGEQPVLDLVPLRGARRHAADHDLKAGLGGQGGKSEWPELVGKKSAHAKSVIEQERPDLTVTVIPYGAAVTMDLREDRVRIFENQRHRVSHTPVIG
ncbi:serine protease inhibitor [Streptomyces sp. NPDC054863]